MITEHLNERPSLKDTQHELKRYLLALSILLNDFYGAHALRAVLKGDPSEDTDWGVLANADVSNLRFCKLLPEAYDFAFNGRMSDVMEDQAFASPSYFEQLNGFLQMLEPNELLGSVWNEPSIIAETFPSGGLQLLVDTGLARANLDQQCELQAKEIALLAGITERSVQNAFSAKGTGRLKSEKKYGSSYVSPDEARRWLADKKGFVATTLISFDAIGPLPDELTSQAELRAFLLPRIEKLCDSAEKLQKFNNDIGLSNDDAGRKFTGDAPINLADAVSIAKALKVEGKWLVTQVLRINHPHEASLLLPDNS